MFYADMLKSENVIFPPEASFSQSLTHINCRYRKVTLFRNTIIAHTFVAMYSIKFFYIQGKYSLVCENAETTNNLLYRTS